MHGVEQFAQIGYECSFPQPVIIVRSLVLVTLRIFHKKGKLEATFRLHLSHLIRLDTMFSYAVAKLN